MDESSGFLRYSSKLKHRNECMFDEIKERKRVKEKKT